MSFKERFVIMLLGQFVGSDPFGNRYYREKKAKKGQTERRWVKYKGLSEASKVPASWHGWLHHTYQEPPLEESTSYAWQKPHQPNLSGTSNAFHPQQSDDQKETYTPWTPPSK